MKNHPSLTSRTAMAELANGTLSRSKRYVVMLFLLLLAGVYSFVLFQINAYSEAEPSSAEISAQTKAVDTPHVDPATIEQMQDLQDHSVRVQALFDQARHNPFQE